MLSDTERGMIQELFTKLRNVEAQGGARDADAEAFIGQQVSRQPGAPYYMAQTILMQEQALKQAQAHIEALEQQARQPQGFLASLFGGSRPAQPPARHPMPQAYPPAQPQQGMPGGPAGAYQGRMPMAGGAGGGGFLAGAAQTAMGVAGGMLLANAIGSMFSADEAMAGVTDSIDQAAGAASEEFAAIEEDFGGGFEEDPFG